MTRMLTLLSVAATVVLAGALYGTALAAGGCCPTTTQAAKKDSDCCPATQTTQAARTTAAVCPVSGAKKGDFTCGAGGGCDTLTASAESVDMAKGGAAERSAQAAKKDSDCCPTTQATQAAKKDSDCCPSTQATQAALTTAADCPVSGAKKGCGAGGCDTLTASAESVDMAKGGAADSGVAQGYGLNKQVPDFTLEDIHGKTHTLSEYRGKVVSLIFWNHRCPWVVEMDDRLADFTKRYADEVVVLAIDAGINNSVEDIKEYGKDFPFHLLINRDSNLARKFDAKFTPEVFLLDKNGVVVYHGAFDNSRAGSEEEGTRRSYMEDAVKDVLDGRTPDVVQTRAFGCTIKFAPEQTAMADE